ncbi:MAG: tetratricopeptide repeat protein, partial [Myxococcales bacterium]|nr:tetratricopeptide repeat protein [Myxococcales bacterium]
MYAAILLGVVLAGPAPTEDARTQAIRVMNEGYKQATFDKRGSAGLAKFVEATTIDPRYELAWYNLGVAREQHGMTEEAAEAYRSGVAVAAGEAKVELQFRLARADFALAEAASDSRTTRRARLTEARELLAAVVEAEPHRIKARLLLARTLDALDRPVDADAAYRAVIQADPRRSDAFVGLGRMYIDYGHADAGLAVLTLNTEINTIEVGAWLGLGEALLAVDRPAEAVEALKKAARIDPDVVEV